jgi:RNA polymerase sigma-70 factor (ECF subfamily)
MSADGYHGSGNFPVTDWSLVGRAARDSAESQREALGLLLIRYLPALRAHLAHRKQFSPDKADDLLQEFVTSKILERDLLARARHDMGKFRTFLLTALDRFVINRIRDEQASKRSPGYGKLVSFGDRADHIVADDDRADAFHVAWARNVISQALERMRLECAQSGRSDLWEVFQCRVVGPILHGEEPVDYQELVRRCGFRSPMQASNALITAKRMYARVLRAVIGEYARDDAEIDSEIDDLKNILALCNP